MAREMVMLIVNNLFVFKALKGSIVIKRAVVDCVESFMTPGSVPQAEGDGVD
jgi:hypothetical protein